VDAERQQIERILRSKAFRGSEVQRSLLAYLSEKSLAGEADSLKEYTVGLDAATTRWFVCTSPAFARSWRSITAPTASRIR
jgi:hypothetical protein